MVPEIDCVLVHAYVFGEAVGQRTREVHAIQLEYKQAQEEERQYGGVDSVIRQLARPCYMVNAYFRLACFVSSLSPE